MNLIAERDLRNKERKKFKAQIDSEITLSHTPKTAKLTNHRLLDEGAVVGDGYVEFFIKKGTIEKFVNGENKYLDNITDEFIGTVNLGHENFATFPYIIGTFAKEDFKVIDTENDRKGLDVTLHLDEESIFVQELKRQPYDIGLSAEFYYHVDEEATEEYGIEVIDEIQIFAYALVGECGNVNSDGLELKGDFAVENIKANSIDDVKSVIDEVEEKIDEAQAEIDKTIEEENPEEEPIEEPEEVAEEVADEEADGEEACDEESTLEKAEEAFTALEKENKELKEKVEVLEKKLARVQKKLKAKNEEIENFTNKFKGLSVSLGLKKEEENKKESVVTRHRGNNGIGEL